jgi:hypothetical protein
LRLVRLTRCRGTGNNRNKSRRTSSSHTNARGTRRLRAVAMLGAVTP